MKRIIMGICLFVAIGAVACDDTEKANEKLDNCIEDKYDEKDRQAISDKWELDCDDDEDACSECAECYIDKSCEEIFDGKCQDKCEDL